MLVTQRMMMMTTTTWALIKSSVRLLNPQIRRPKQSLQLILPSATEWLVLRHSGEGLKTHILKDDLNAQCRGLQWAPGCPVDR